ncbi:MAG TPA: hypothetical protein VKQ29_15445 [Aliidongia sp.]|nr:hypothetical protein [Aliidongia sp.]
MTAKTALAALAIACGLGAFSAPVRAQQFSADLVDLNADGSRRDTGESGKLFTSGSKVRIDRADASGTRFLLDVDEPSAYVVAPLQRLYMDARQSSVLTELLVPVDPAAPCARWQAMATVAGDLGTDGAGEWRCTPTGSEEVNGRAAVKVLMTSPTGVARTGWIDAALKFPIRIEAADHSVVELRNIDEAPQPRGLFEIAGSFRKYDPEQLIARIKQSDVWVEPPK